MLCICHWFGYFSVAHACFWVIWDNLRNPFLPGNCKEENSLLNTDPSPDSWSDNIKKEMKISNMVWSWVRGDQRRHQILVLGSAFPLIDATAVDQLCPYTFFRCIFQQVFKANSHFAKYIIWNAQIDTIDTSTTLQVRPGWRERVLKIDLNPMNEWSNQHWNQEKDCWRVVGGNEFLGSFGCIHQSTINTQRL